MNEEEDTQYFVDAGTGAWVLCDPVPSGAHQFPGHADDGNGGPGHVPAEPGPVHDDLRRADPEYCKAGQPAG